MTLLGRFSWFLVPSFAQIVTSSISIPMATLWLGPADYGAYALTVAFSSLASGISSLGSSFIFAQKHASSSPNVDMAQTVSTHVLLSLTMSTACAYIMVNFWSDLGLFVPNLSSIPQRDVDLAALSILPTTMWSLAADLLTLNGRARFFAAVVIAQAIVSTAALLSALIWFTQDAHALFIANAVGSLVLGAGATSELWRYRAKPDFSQFKNGAITGGAAISLSNIFDALYTVFERNLLLGFSGLASVGLYSHAQQYGGLVAVAVKALARAIWPVTLAEFKESQLKFRRTRHHWNIAYFAIGMVGIFFATIGSELIGFITHGKFSSAGPFATACIACLLVQNMGKPVTAAMYSTGRAVAFAKYVTLIGLVRLLVVVVAVPLCGAWGALVALLAYHVVFRIAMRLIVTDKVKLPYQDQWALTEFLLVAVIMGIIVIFSIEFRLKILILLAVGLTNSFLFIRLNKKY